MRRQRKGIRTTREKLKDALEESETNADNHPPISKTKQNHLFYYLGKLDKTDGTIYVNLTGNFPIRSMAGMTTVFILYNWTSNAILATPILDAKDEIMVKAFRDNVEYLTKRGFKPVFNIRDNGASKAVKAYLVSENIDLQLVEPHNHRINAAEHAI